jgi:hypothetical protein
MTPIYTIIQIALARWHFDRDERPNTETNLRKAIEKLPPWAGSFHWYYVQDESWEYGLVAEDTGLEFETEHWGKLPLKFKIVALEWFGENRNDTQSIPKSLEDLRLVMENSHWAKRRQ